VIANAKFILAFVVSNVSTEFMGTKSTQKKSQEPLVIFLRLYDEAKTRMEAVCAKFSTDHNKVGMAGTLAEIYRLETLPPSISPDEWAAISEMRALGIPLLPHLEAIISDAAQSTLTGIQGKRE
jgi:hypothetical protein